MDSAAQPDGLSVVLGFELLHPGFVGEHVLGRNLHHFFSRHFGWRRWPPDSRGEIVVEEISLDKTNRLYEVACCGRGREEVDLHGVSLHRAQEQRVAIPHGEDPPGGAAAP